MADVEALLGARAHERSAPAAADAIAFTGGLGIAVGVLALSADYYAHGHGRWPGIALFLVLIAVGYLALGLLPREIHPAAVTLIVAGVPGAIGWWLLPHAHRFADVRPFIILTILAWTGCWLAPRTRGRTVFVGVVLLLFWLWMIGEAAGNDAYSAAPIPSPPAHTMFSLSALHNQVTLGELDSSDPLYPIALQCNFSHGSACDTLYDEAEAGSDFETFADTCGETQPAGSGDQCAQLSGNGDGFTLPDDNGSGSFGTTPPRFGNVGAGSSDKSLEIGLVSLLFGIAYVGALLVFDRRRWHGLGTALVIPGFLALFTGTEVLGNAAHHVWFGGVLTFVAGVAFALVGDFGGRRFSAWAGAALAAFGAYTFAGDATDFQKSFDDVNPHFVRPALITIGFGIALVVLAWVIAFVRSSFSGTDGSVPPGPQPEPPPTPTPSYAMPAPPPSAPWDAPAAPPPSAPWQPPPVPPPSPPWQPPPPSPPPGGSPT